MIIWNKKWAILKGKPQTYKRSLKIPKGGNQNPYIEEEQTTQKKENKRTNNDLQNIHIKLKIE
jgi:hypothetical protein